MSEEYQNCGLTVMCKKEEKNLKKLLKIVKNEKQDAKLRALKKLKQIGNKKTIESLYSIMEEEIGDIKSEIFKTIRYIELEEYMKKLLNKNGEIRELTIKELLILTYGDSTIIERLLENLKHQEWNIRYYSADSLLPFLKSYERSKKKKYELAKEPLSELLKDEIIEVRIGAAKALTHFKEVQVEDTLFHALEKTKKEEFILETILALHEISDNRVHPGDERIIIKLLNLSKSVDVKIRRKSIKILRNLEKKGKLILPLIQLVDKEAIEPLIELLIEGNKQTRYHVRYMLRERGENAIDCMNKTLEGKMVWIRETALVAFFKQNDERIIELITEILKDKSQGGEKLNVISKCKLVEVLEREHIMGDNLGEIDFFGIIIKALEEDNYNVRLQAIKSLNNIGDKRAIIPLSSTLERETHEYVKDYLRETLKKLNERVNT